MVDLLSLQSIAGEVVFVVVDLLVTARAQQHEVVDGVDIFRAQAGTTSRTFRTERYDVCQLAEVAFDKGHRMFEEIFVAAVEFAATARSCDEE